MKKIGILLFSLLFTATIFSQKKLPNPKIGKNETEISSFIMADDYLAFGGQLVYRLSVIKKLKIGGGVLYGANYKGYAYDHNLYGYGAVFADALQFLGHREKWSFGGQLGHGIYNPDHGYDTELKAGIYYSISCNYRAIVSKKILFTTSLLMGKRNFVYQSGGPAPGNSGFIGLKFGVVF